MEPETLLKMLRKMCHEPSLSIYYSTLYEAIKIVAAFAYDCHEESVKTSAEIDYFKTTSLEESVERFRIKANIK